MSTWRVIHGDCLEVLKSIPAGSVDAVVTDPPYGIAHKCNFNERGRGALARCNDYADVAGDDVPFDPAPILALNVPTVLWGANHYADRLPKSGGWVVWDKRVKQGVGVNDQSDAELAWTNCIKGVRVFRHMWNGMWRDSERGEHYHPTQKPAALYRWLFSLPWIPKGTILDPYMGSGPCGVACMQTGRNFIGIEIDAGYCEIARRRISEAANTLWTPEPKETQPEMFQ